MSVAEKERTEQKPAGVRLSDIRSGIAKLPGSWFSKLGEGRLASWKRRYLLLEGCAIHYYKFLNDSGQPRELKGTIQLAATSEVSVTIDGMLSIRQPHRLWSLNPESKVLTTCTSLSHSRTHTLDLVL